MSDVPKRLLVVSYRFPPDGSVGGLRWAGLGKYLARAGWDVHLLTAARGAAGAIREFTAYECPRWATLNDAYRRLADAERREAVPVAPAAARQAPEREGPLRLIRREVASLMSFPDESRGWTLRAAWRARGLVRRLRPDLVVSSGPPHSAHVVARLAVAGTSVPLVVDLRDPWSHQSRAWRDHPVYGRRVARRLIRWLEHMVLRRAAAVIANTTALRTALGLRFPALSVHWLPNGVDPERVRAVPEPPFPGLAVAHVGTLYGGRDPRVLLEAFRAVLDRDPRWAAAGSRLRFAGHVDAVHAGTLAGAVRELALEPFVDRLGVLPPAEAISVLRRSTVAVVLAQQQELQVPGKLYEAVYLGCSTLVVAEGGSASAAEAGRLGVPCVEPDDVDGLAGALERLARDGPRAPAGGVTSLVDYATLSGELRELLVGLTAR